MNDITALFAVRKNWTSGASREDFQLYRTPVALKKQLERPRAITMAVASGPKTGLREDSSAKMGSRASKYDKLESKGATSMVFKHGSLKTDIPSHTLNKT